MFGLVKNLFSYGLNGIFLLLDSLVYWVVSELYDLFYKLATNHFFTEDIYQEIANRILVVVGVVMLFYLAYSLLKALVNPDELNKATGKIVTNLVISLVLIAIVPTIFTYAFQVQNIVLEEQIIDKLVFGNTNNTLTSVGRNTAMTFFEAFAEVPPDAEIDHPKYDNWADLRAGIIENEKGVGFKDVTYLAQVFKAYPEESSYTPILGALCGAFLVYVIFSFCLDLGIRVVKLAFYQIISPIPIMMRVIPEKKSVFDNWLKATIATYLEVFIRIFIMYLIAFICAKVLNGVITFQNFGIFGTIIVLMGIFAFAKQAPKLIGDVMGVDSGSIKLGVKDKLNTSFIGKNINKASSGALGFISGGLGGMATSMANGAGASGFWSGAYNGWKGKGMQFGKQRQKLYSDYGLEGKAGLFGGRNSFDQKLADAKRNAKKSYAEVRKNELERYENSRPFQDKFNELFEQRREEQRNDYNNVYAEYQAKATEFEENKNDRISRLQNQLDSERAEFENNKRDELTRLQNQLASERAAFDSDKQNSLNQLNMAYERASRNHDITEMARINSERENIQNSAYDDTMLQNSISELRNSQFQNNELFSRIFSIQNEQYHNSELEDKMAELSRPIDESLIKRETQKYFRDNDKQYKDTSKYVAKHNAEKAAREWRENNQEDYLTQVAIQEEAMRRINRPGGSNSSGGNNNSTPPPNTGNRS